MRLLGRVPPATSKAPSPAPTPVLRRHEEARAKGVKDLVDRDKAMNGHRRWRQWTPEEQASRNYSHFAAQEVLKKSTHAELCQRRNKV